MNKKRIVLVAIALVLTTSITGVIVARPPGGGEVAIDKGSSVKAPDATAGPKSNSKGAADGTPEADPKAVQGTPVPTQPPAVVDGAVGNFGPIVLLNPAIVRPGSTIGVAGSGFDPGATVDIYVRMGDAPPPPAKGKSAAPEAPVTFVQLDKSGSFGGVTIPVPSTTGAGAFTVEVKQRKSTKAALAAGSIAIGSPTANLGIQAGRPGDTVELALYSFAPGEDVQVFWNSLGGVPVATLKAGPDGNLLETNVKVPFGAVGNNSFIFIGSQSQSPVTAGFLVLALFPSVNLSSYAIKADEVIRLTGKDFGPSERVMVYLNRPEGPPLLTLQADAAGAFTDGAGFVVPFSLRGKQTLIFIGELSRAPATVSFDVLPYTPSVQPSTYGGRPGTNVTFYGMGFAKLEVVHVYTGRTEKTPGKLVDCFSADDQGNAGARGSYVIPSSIPPGPLLFTFIGQKSNAITTTSVEVIPSEYPVQVPDREGFVCPLQQAQGTDGGQAMDAAVNESAAPTPTAAPAPTPTPVPTVEPEPTKKPSPTPTPTPKRRR